MGCAGTALKQKQGSAGGCHWLWVTLLTLWEHRSVCVCVYKSHVFICNAYIVFFSLLG